MRSRNVQGRAVAATLLLAGGALPSACTETQPPAGSPLRLAASRPESGALATEGMNVERGYRLAVRVLNDQGGMEGREVELILVDDRGDPDEAARIYEEFVTDESIDLLLGPYASSITQAVVPVVEEAGRPMIAPLAASEEIWVGQGREWSVQLLNNARENLGGAVAVAAGEGAETVALVYEDSRFPVSAAGGVRDAVTEFGLELVLDESYPVGGADHGALTRRARDLEADFFLGAGYIQDDLAFVRAVGAAGYHPLLTSWSIAPSEPDFVEEVGVDLARCVIGNAPWAESLATEGPLATNAEFVQEYRDEYGVAPGYTAAAAFATVELLAAAARDVILESGEIPEPALRDYLFGRTLETVLGPYGVAALGDADAGLQLRLTRKQLQWQDDGAGGLELLLIYPPGDAEAEPCTNPPPEGVAF